MKWMTAACIVLLSASWWAGAEEPYRDSPVVADGASLELLAKEFIFTEGPAPDPTGNVYFTDQPNNRIMVWTVSGKLETFLQPSGRSNGLFFDRTGRLVACADDKNELWRIDVETKQVEVLVKDYQGKLLNAPNDLWIHPDGSIYFTDPWYKRNYWERGPSEQDTQAVYRLDPDGQTLKRTEPAFKTPNGIIGSRDGKTLYIADLGEKKTYRFTVAADGSLQDRHLFCEMGSDGMTLDTVGNVYLTGRGVTVFNPAGEKIQQIDVPSGWTANVCFGGPGRDSLYITAKEGLYRLRMKTRGAY